MAKVHELRPRPLISCMSFSLANLFYLFLSFFSNYYLHWRPVILLSQYSQLLLPLVIESAYWWHSIPTLWWCILIAILLFRCFVYTILESFLAWSRFRCYKGPQRKVKERNIKARKKLTFVPRKKISGTSPFTPFHSFEAASLAFPFFCFPFSLKTGYSLSFLATLSVCTSRSIISP